ncbi:MAG: carbamoyl-phosphate synthase large subunit [Gammaproteobacteria bacterium]|nr:MAG: carbamoyl-phosphate synthase large subunit [Gammaproteobacteria bacterium]RTZ70031.1 MAG: carbamoyl-phosphate synthase large subunit [Aquificaceae bacterium]
MSKKPTVVILGSGPNRIGQGIEFDYACVHAIWGLQEEGYETVMVNCNPETVSTDYDTADKLYFEPIVYENVLDIVEKENPVGVFVQFGGQTPLKLALPLKEAGVRILGTPPESIDRAEDRELFRELLLRLGLKQPPSGTATSLEDALKVAEKIGYPVLVRPSYVLGGRAMRIIYEPEELKEWIKEAVQVSNERPILIDKYLENTVELDVDAVADTEDVLIGAVMEHIEEAGVHSGDSAASIPTYSLPQEVVLKVKEYSKKLALALNVKGLINIQFAVKDGDIYVLEVNPRSSRSVPYVSKSVGYPLAKLAVKVGVGRTLRELVPEVFKRIEEGNVHFASDFLPADFPYYTVKEVVFPWDRFPEEDPVLGPEMKSTGEVMGVDKSFGLAYYKAQLSAGMKLPSEGTVFISVADKDKPQVVDIAKEFSNLGFKILATRGTYKFLKERGVNAQMVLKYSEGRPNIVDLILNREVDLIINTPSGKRERSDAYYIRRVAVQERVPYYTTLRASRAVLEAIKEYRKVGGKLEVYSLQDIFSNLS